MMSVKTGHLRAGLALAALTLVAGCAGGNHEGERWPEVPARNAPANPAPVYTPPAPPPVVAAPVQPAPAPAAPAQAYHPAANDMCGAQALQYLIGRPRTEIPVPLQPSTRRVVCSSCVITQEYRADRQTIIFDSDTGLIKSVACG